MKRSIVVVLCGAAALAASLAWIWRPKAPPEPAPTTDCAPPDCAPVVEVLPVLHAPAHDVTPRRLRSCATDARTTCSLVLDVPIDAARIVSATLGGRPAVVRGAKGAHLELEWPEGLVHGQHTLEVRFTHGPPLVDEVELVDADPMTVVELSPFVGLLAPGPSRLVEVGGALPIPFFQHTASLRHVIYRHSGVALLHVDPQRRPVMREGSVLVDRKVPLELNAARNAVIVSDERGFVIVGQAGIEDDDAIHAFEIHLDDQGDELPSLRRALSLPVSDRRERVAAAGSFDGTLLVAIVKGAPAPSLRVVAIDREGFAPSPKSIRTDPRLRDFARDALFDDLAGSWLGKGALFLSTCGSPRAPSGLAVVPLADDGRIVLGAPHVLRDGRDRSRAIVACQGTREGFYFVEEDERGAHLYRADVEGLELVRTLPRSIPGVADRLERGHGPDEPPRSLPGLLAFEVQPDGSVLLLVAPRHEAVPRVALYVLEGRGAARRLADVPVRMRAAAGDLCIARSEETRACLGEALDECGPAACSVGVPLLASHASIHAHHGHLLRSRATDRVHVVLELEHRARQRSSAFARAELQHHVVRIP